MFVSFVRDAFAPLAALGHSTPPCRCPGAGSSAVAKRSSRKIVDRLRQPFAHMLMCHATPMRSYTQGAGAFTIGVAQTPLGSSSLVDLIGVPRRSLPQFDNSTVAFLDMHCIG